MIKALTSLIIIFFTALPALADTATGVALRYSRQNNIVRIVMESDENTIANANTITTLSNIKIEFPRQFQISVQKDFMFDTTRDERLLTIALKNVSDIKMFKLYSPARIVIDIEMSGQVESKSAQQPVRDAESATSAEDVQLQEKKIAEESEKAGNPKIVIIDPGHGGYDYGIIEGDYNEKDFVLDLSRKIADGFSKKGIKVFLTRKVDQSAPISDRIVFSQNKNSGLFISFHAAMSDTVAIYTAAVEESSDNPAERLYGVSSKQNRHIEKSRAMAARIGRAIKKHTGFNVVLREMPLPLLKSMGNAAVLIETPIKLASSEESAMKFGNAVIMGAAPDEE